MVDVIETDENGLNARIQFHLLPAGKMAEFGFRDCDETLAERFRTARV